MSRGSIPFGYRIEKGIAVVCEEEAAQLRGIYMGYLSGLSLTNAARNAGITMRHTSVKHLMQNPRYLGDAFYPAIIDRKTFDAFEEERRRRETALGRSGRQKKTMEKRPAPTVFQMAESVHTFTDPYRQAEYLYTLIESEV